MPERHGEGVQTSLGGAVDRHTRGGTNPSPEDTLTIAGWFLPINWGTNSPDKMMGASRLILTSLSPARNASTPFVKLMSLCTPALLTRMFRSLKLAPVHWASAVQSDSFATSQVLT